MKSVNPLHILNNQSPMVEVCKCLECKTFSQ